LFAGTENSVYVSFDDGDHWQPLQLNLPHTSMRDLTLHGDDLVVGTHGRSFWILDDITPLRQLSAEAATSQAHLYRPQVAYRVRWNRNTDTPHPPEVPTGKNPPDGAIVNYYLRSAATGEVALEIIDSGGKLVRRFSSRDQPEPIEKELNVPTYWVRPTQILSADAGMHRLVWDLRYPAPASSSYEYPISAIYRDTPRAPRGPLALPGLYTVKLRLGDRNYTQQLMVKMDPRVKTRPADVARQFEIASGIARGMNDDFAALKQVQALRAQLKELKAKAGEGKLAEPIAALEGKAEALEGKAEDPFSAPPPGGIERQNLSRLNRDLGHLLSVVDGTDAPPTQSALATYGELQRSLTELLASWNELRTRNLVALNEQLKSNHLPEIIVTAASR
jgi:hypothetical protein